jgi:hypothetical protein
MDAERQGSAEIGGSIVKTATRRAFVDRCEKLGIMWKDDGGTLEIDAPAGFVIANTGTHWLGIRYEGGRWLKGEAYAAMMEDMAGGIEKCDEEDCDVCEGRS